MSGLKRKASLNNNYEMSSDSDDSVPLVNHNLISNQSKLKKPGLSSEIKQKPSKSSEIKKPINNDSDDSSDLSDDDVEDEDDDFKSKDNKSSEIIKESKPKIKKEPKTPTKSPKIKKEITVMDSSPKKVTKSKGKAVKVKEEDNVEKEEEEEKEEEYKWWLNQQKDDTIKWNTLEHQGVYFPPAYEPHGIKMKYDGSPVTLSPEAEECASFFAALDGTDYAENTVFQKNFFNDFLAVTGKQIPPCPIKKFEKCDFSPIKTYLNEQRDLKKAMTKEQKDLIKKEKAKIDEFYGSCILDGRKEKVGNFRIEPPNLFRGRGEHPKTGTLKSRVLPEQGKSTNSIHQKVTINIGKEAKIPEPPAGHKWEKVIHDNTVSWLAMWKENVNDNFKYVFLAANSSLKGMSDMKKFEKARELKKHVDKIRIDYNNELKDKSMAVRQRATAMYFIDRLALRAGNEKGEDEADTVGCCSLRYEHIELEAPDKVIFDFLGKDSIRYHQEVIIEPQIFKNLKIFKKEPKVEGDLLFDRLNTSQLNKHLSSYMKGLSAKVFRTYNASHTFQQELNSTPENGSVDEKILAYNRANRQVAILCNHQRSIPKTHHTQLAKIQDKILGYKYERSLIKKEMIKQDPKLKKTRPELIEPESELDDEFIERYLKSIEDKELEKHEKKVEKSKEKGESLIVFKESKVKDLSEYDFEKLDKKFSTLSENIKKQKFMLVDKDEGKTAALSTSKINYIDPRISVSWCEKHQIDKKKIFNKTLQDKFKWALDTQKDWMF